MKFSIQTLIWVSVLLALLVAGSLAFLPKPIEVETAPAAAETLTVTVQEDGKTRIREKYIISAPVAGRLSRIELNAGDAVTTQKTLVAVIMPAEPEMLNARAKARAEAQVDQANAALKRAEANVETSKVQFGLSETRFERLKGLKAKNAVSQGEYDTAEAEYLSNSHSLRTSRFDEEIAAFELKMAKAALLQFDDSDHKPFELYTPISGKVLRVFQESATVLTVGTPLIEVGDPTNLEIEIDVLSTDAVQIEAGAELTVEHWGGKNPLQGRVRVIEPAAFTKVSSLGVEEQRVNVIADFDEPPQKIATLGDGYRIEAKIVIDESPKALCIPNSALFRVQRQWHVFVADEGVATLRAVKTGSQNEDKVQILEGLEAGEAVILYPSDRLTPGAAVVVEDSKT